MPQDLEDICMRAIAVERDDRYPTADALATALRGFLSNRLLDLGLICRADDRGEPVIQLSPPLIAGEPEFDFIVDVSRRALDRAVTAMAE